MLFRLDYCLPVVWPMNHVMVVSSRQIAFFNSRIPPVLKKIANFGHSLRT
jgi:hypothetical protein